MIYDKNLFFSEFKYLVDPYISILYYLENKI